jgi:hypothetical protein
MVWFFALALTAANDGGPGAAESTTALAPTYCIQVVEKDGTTTTYRRVAGDASVVDALASLPGVVPRLGKARIRVIRSRWVLPVDWDGIVRFGRVNTNYLLSPRDLLLVQLQ